MISLLIPFRDDGSRRAQFDWLQERYAALYPHAEVIVAEDDGGTPFSKTIAVNNAYRRASGDVLAIVDADVWVEPRVFQAAEKRIQSGRISWVRPCNTVYRINQSVTNRIVARRPMVAFPKITAADCERVTPVVGLVCVFSRELFESVGGMDPRFRGWGWEDTCFNQIMDFKSKRCLIQRNPVYHLWHPRLRGDGKPVWEGQTSRNNVVGQQYKQAYKNVEMSVKLIETVKGLTGI
jgi:predicted glycosyltransferase involved in capsule biosynthesis